MMEPSVEDWTPPVCDITSLQCLMATPVRPSQPEMLCWFQLNIQLSCSEEATIQVFWGNVDDADASRTGVFVTPWYRCPAGSCWINGFDLLFADYGLAQASLWLTVSAYDEAGNLHNSSTVLDVGAVQGITSVGRAQDCGAPELECPQCLDEPWAYPESSTAAPPPDWVSGTNTMPPDHNPYPDSSE